MGHKAQLKNSGKPVKIDLDIDAEASALLSGTPQVRMLKDAVKKAKAAANLTQRKVKALRRKVKKAKAKSETATAADNVASTKARKEKNTARKLGKRARRSRKNVAKELRAAKKHTANEKATEAEMKTINGLGAWNSATCSARHQQKPARIAGKGSYGKSCPRCQPTCSRSCKGAGRCSWRKPCKPAQSSYCSSLKGSGNNGQGSTKICGSCSKACNKRQGHKGSEGHRKTSLSGEYPRTR